MTFGNIKKHNFANLIHRSGPSVSLGAERHAQGEGERRVRRPLTSPTMSLGAGREAREVHPRSKLKPNAAICLFGRGVGTILTGMRSIAKRASAGLPRPPARSVCT